MRRADRLFQIVQYLRAGRLLTAKILSERLEVSERTIYRDIADLQGSGVPIDGEAGIGYLMREGYDLPPLMFSREEISALMVGSRMVGAWGGVQMALAAETALGKIENVLPDDMRGKANATPVFAHDFQMPAKMRERFDLINESVQNREILAISYQDPSSQLTKRKIEPLGLYYWGKNWTVASWCALRNDFRSFRIDRILKIEKSGEKAKAVKGKTLHDYLKAQSSKEGCELPPSTRNEKH